MGYRLDEVTYLRVLATIGLVIMHSFTMYAGNWPYPIGISDVKLYYWIQKFTFSCMLELFVFISGYIFYFQLSNKKLTFKDIVFKKFKRLLLPSIFFSLLYCICIDKTIPNSIVDVYHIVIGEGHLWFLPMLFLCFLFGFFIYYLQSIIKISSYTILALLATIALFSSVSLPLRLSSVMYYLFYFYLGGLIFNFRTVLVKTNRNVLVAIAFLYVIILILGTLLNENIKSLELDSVLSHILIKFSMIIYATLGIITLYILVLKRKFSSHILPQYISFISTCSFGIYIFHQFILEILYYDTNLPIYLGKYCLPILGCLLAFGVSAALSFYSLKTKLGRIIIG